MKKKHATNEKLDAVLTVLNNFNTELIKAQGFEKLSIDTEIDSVKIHFALVSIGVKDIDSAELQLILPYLISENYIEKTNLDFEKNYKTIYKIRFNGKVFIENGGYVIKQKQFEEQTSRQERLEKNVRYLNYVIGIGTGVAAIYYLLEIFILLK